MRLHAHKANGTHGKHDHPGALAHIAHRATDRSPPASSLLGVSVATRLGVSAGALAVLWLTIMWALS